MNGLTKVSLRRKYRVSMPSSSSREESAGSFFKARSTLTLDHGVYRCPVETVWAHSGVLRMQNLRGPDRYSRDSVAQESRAWSGST